MVLRAFEEDGITDFRLTVSTTRVCSFLTLMNNGCRGSNSGLRAGQDNGDS